MKHINKIMLFIFACVTLSHLPTNCFYNDGYPNNALSGAAIGGLAGGRRGAAIGLGVGMSADIIGAAARRDRRRREEEDYYRRREDEHYRSPHRQRLENENADLKRRLRQYEE